MYRKFWGLQQQPFVDSIDHRFSFLTGEHRQILQEIVKLSVHPGNLIVLNGVSGIGKTQLLMEIALKLVANGYFVFHESLPCLDTQSLTDFLKRQIENRTKSVDTNSTAFESNSLESSEPISSALKEEEIPILFVDGMERQNSNHIRDFIENYRRLTFRKGAETSPVIAGNISSELLADWKIYWSFQTNCEFRVPTLDHEDVENYIRHRWRISGGEADRLSEDIFSPILALTHGIPRDINHLCTMSLLVGFSENAETLTHDIVLKAAKYTDRIQNHWHPLDSETHQNLVTAKI